VRQVLPVEFDLDAILALPSPEKEFQLDAVAAYKRKVDENPLWAFRPHEGEKQRKQELGEPLTGEESRGQLEFLELNQRDVFTGAAVAGNRFGKTTIGLIDGLIQTLPDHFLPPWLLLYKRRPYKPDYRLRIVVVEDSFIKKTWIPEIRRWIPPACLRGGTFEKAWNAKDRQLTFADGSWWDFVTHNMPIDSFSGLQLDRVVFDEEPPGEMGKQQYEESQARLIDRGGDIRFTLTPLLGYSWLYFELSEENVYRRDQEVCVVTGSIDDNPALGEKEVKRQIARWEKSGTANARRHGRFTHFAGMIFPEFRKAAFPDGHIVADRPIPRRDDESKPDVPIYEVIDPGIDHPAALTFFWVSSEDLVEVFFSQKWAQIPTVDEFVAKRELVLATLNFKPRWTVIDPSARNRNWQTGRNLQDVLSREFKIATIPGQNAVQPGINEIRTRLITSRIVFHEEGASDLIDEFGKYRWKNVKRQSEDEPKLEPVKSDDDCMDTLRYGLMSLPQRAKAPDEDKPDGWNDPQRRLVREDLKRRLRGSRHERVGTSRR
jgi:hypothetical protein